MRGQTSSPFLAPSGAKKGPVKHDEKLDKPIFINKRNFSRMTTATAVGANSNKEVNWHSINWKKAHRIVNRLQARIVKAIWCGNHGKVRALQWILTHSLSAKVLAIRSVTRG